MMTFIFGESGCAEVLCQCRQVNVTFSVSDVIHRFYPFVGYTGSVKISSYVLEYRVPRTRTRGSFCRTTYLVSNFVDSTAVGRAFGTRLNFTC